MRVCHSLIFFFLALRDGGTAFFDTYIGVRTGAEGGNVRVGCTFSFSGSREIFCRGDCEDGDILVETSGVSNQSGRYSIEYIEESLASFPMIYVSITNLTKSDSGRYSCELGREWAPDASQTFDLQVTDAPTTIKPNWTPRRFSATTFTTIRTTWTQRSTSVSPTNSTASSKTTNGSEKQPLASNPASLLFVRLVLVILIIISSSAVLIFCMRKRRSQAEDPHVELDHVNVTEGHQVYEEVGEEQRRGRSPPEETS